MENGPDKLTKPVSSGPLIRRPPTDSKRPWLDWKRDEPVPSHLNNNAPVKKIKSLWAAVCLLWIFCFCGLHRFYIGDKKGGWLWIFGVFIFAVTAVSLGVATGDASPWVQAAFYAAVSAIIIREYFVLRARVFACNSELISEGATEQQHLSIRVAVLLLLLLPYTGAHRFYIEEFSGGIIRALGFWAIMISSTFLLPFLFVNTGIIASIQTFALIVFYITEYFVLKRAIELHNQKLIHRE